MPTYLCPDCDLPLKAVACQRGERARCPRCRKVIDSCKASADTCRATILAALVLFIPANLLPVMTIIIDVDPVSGTLLSSVTAFWEERLYMVSAMVFLFAIMVPLLQLLITLLILLPNITPGRTGLVMMRCRHWLHGWCMLDIFLLGVLVAAIKLEDFSLVTIEPGFWCLATVMALEIYTSQKLPKESLWNSYHQQLSGSSP